MKFKVGQKVVCVADKRVHKEHVVKIPIGEVVVVKGYSKIFAGNIYIHGYERALDGCIASYDVTQFAPLIETDQFIEMTYTKILETTPKVSMS